MHNLDTTTDVQQSKRRSVMQRKKRSRVCLLEGSKVASNNIQGSQTGRWYFIEFPRMYMTALFFQLFLAKLKAK